MATPFVWMQALVSAVQPLRHPWARTAAGTTIPLTPTMMAIATIRGVIATSSSLGCRELGRPERVYSER
jgi:hypothetical protein